jgi:NAD(P)-dependent dehydrogenase (short-subunit alcohol dehydrogenase family)
MAPEPVCIRTNYKGSKKLQTKVALITGGDSGIEWTVAVHFACEGADVALSYKPEEQADADETRALAEAAAACCGPATCAAPTTAQASWPVLCSSLASSISWSATPPGSP